MASTALRNYSGKYVIYVGDLERNLLGYPEGSQKYGDDLFWRTILEDFEIKEGAEIPQWNPAMRYNNGYGENQGERVYVFERKRK